VARGDTAALRRTYADLASHFRCEAMGLLPLYPGFGIFDLPRRSK